MAVVTHGGVLPDSAQKTDFYGIVDNSTVTSITSADISASAGILDTQLNTISTAGKVNTSALTGQIANANLVQLTTPALVSGAAFTLLPNIPSGAGVIPTANLPMLILGVHTTATQSIPDTSFSQRTFGAIDIDSGGYWASNTYTPKVAGWYDVNYMDGLTTTGTVFKMQLAIYKNGSLYATSYMTSAGNNGTLYTFPVSAIVQMNGSTDNISFYIYQTNGSQSLNAISGAFASIVRVL